MPFAGLSAQDTLTLNPAIAFVVSGGTWDQGHVHGTFRLTVVRGGNAADRLYAQWMQDDPAGQHVIGTSVVSGITGGNWTLEAPEIGRGPTGGYVARVHGADDHAGKNGIWLIPLGLPGTLTTARKY